MGVKPKSRSCCHAKVERSRVSTMSTTGYLTVAVFVPIERRKFLNVIVHPNGNFGVVRSF